MLAAADDAHGAREALEQVAHLERLAQVVVLVHVERLQVLAAREDDGVVLVLGLALADDRVARQLDLVRTSLLRASLRVDAEQHAIVPAPCPPWHGLDVGDLEVGREAVAQLVDAARLPPVVGLLRVSQLGVDLARDDVLELGRRRAPPPPSRARPRAAPEMRSASAYSITPRTVRESTCARSDAHTASSSMGISCTFSGLTRSLRFAHSRAKSDCSRCSRLTPSSRCSTALELL